MTLPSPSIKALVTLPSLWIKALATLPQEDQLVLLDISHDKLKILDKIIQVAKAQWDNSRQKQWTYSWNGEVIILRDVAEKTLVWVDTHRKTCEITQKYQDQTVDAWGGFLSLLQVNSWLFQSSENSSDVAIDCCE